jgi:hypothetical protein
VESFTGILPWDRRSRPLYQFDNTRGSRRALPGSR